MPRTFDSPSTYRASYSLLGRAVRTWVDDRLRGEALFIVTLTALSLGLLLSHYLGWALLKQFLAAHPTWQMVFWGGQLASILVLAGIGLVGVCPAVRVTCSPNAVTLRQGDRSCTLPLSSIEEVALISARRYHRHYRRYAATRIFVSVRPNEVIRLRTDKGPVIVGLSELEAQSALLDHLKAAHTSAPAPVAQAQS